MAKFIIADEVDQSKTADILSSGAVEVAPIYQYAFINSGTGTGCIAAGAVYLHTVSITNTAAAGSVFVISNSPSASAVADAVGSSASAAAIIDNGSRQTYLFDAYLNSGLCYRLSGIDCKGITVTYQLA
jgi:hypothetical protein